MSAEAETPSLRTEAAATAATEAQLHPTARLILFDIDGTLLASGGAGERSLREAIRELHGTVDDLRDIEIAGRTDSGIARQVCQKYGVEPTPENLAHFFETYLKYLVQLLPATSGRLLPGIPDLLRALQGKEDVILGLLTGNLQRGAELKLTHYGIWDFFQFGAWADDHHDRNELGRFATGRLLEKHGIRIPGERIYVLGDTPHDISCARAFGARAVAVATGVHTRAQLAQHAPDFLFDDFSDIPAVLHALSVEA